jgi:hypothetical protein
MWSGLGQIARVMNAKAGPLALPARCHSMAESYDRATNPARRFTGLRHHAKVHSFRVITVILAWLMIAAAFYERPELLTALQRAVQRGIEVIGDTIPSPWGPRIEFVFREIGGLIWLQITLVVVSLRILLSGIAGGWRWLRRRDGPHG